MNINYIVAVYLGPRRSKAMQLTRQLDILYHIKRHLEVIKQMNIQEISRITFVINEYDNISTELAVEYIQKFELLIEKVILVRPNLGFSYGAWQQALIESLGDGFDYAFLIEDDYIPVESNFLDLFLLKFVEAENSDTDVAFVCQLWVDNHASISNGLISYDSVIHVFDNRRRLCNDYQNIRCNIFDLRCGDSYDDAIYNQLNYLNYFIENGYNCVDTSKQSLILFLESDWDRLKRYGNLTMKNYIGINIPNFELKYRLATVNDCEVINRIRNSYAKEYLHDSRIFTLDETINWFNNNELVKEFYYIMILCNDITIGYFRISRYSELNNSCYIGADIDDRFTGFGLGYAAYSTFLPMLRELSLFKNPLNKVSLEVLETNKRAINLYNKLGFEQSGILYDEVVKDGEYINSILMVKFLK